MIHRYPVFLLLLPLLLLCSCVSTVNQYFVRQALVTDEALMLQSPITELWQVDGQYYARAYLGKARGTQKGLPVKSIFYQEPDNSFRPTTSDMKVVYATLSHGLKGELPAYFRVQTSYLTALPAQAKRIPLPHPAIPEYSGRNLQPTVADNHKYYAYPLAALTAVCIDLPATVIMSAALPPSLALYGVAVAIISPSQQKKDD